MVDHWERLHDLARHGHRQAACQLARATRRCWSWHKVEGIQDTLVGQAASLAPGSVDEDQGIAVIDVINQDWAEERDLCQDLPATWLQQAWVHELRAAQMGDSVSAMRYATDPPMDPEHMGDELEAWRVYGAQYWPRIEQAISDGHLQAVMQAIPVAAGTSTLHAMPRTHRDLRRAWRYLHLLRLATPPAEGTPPFAEEEALVRAQLSLAARQKAETEAEAIYARSFAAQVPLDSLGEWRKEPPCSS